MNRYFQFNELHGVSCHNHCPPLRPIRTQSRNRWRNAFGWPWAQLNQVARSSESNSASITYDKHFGVVYGSQCRMVRIWTCSLSGAITISLTHNSPCVQTNSSDTGLVLFVCSSHSSNVEPTCVNAPAHLALYTVSQKKVPAFKLYVTLSNLNRFSKFLHCWKAHEICYETYTTLPASP